MGTDPVFDIEHLVGRLNSAVINHEDWEPTLYAIAQSFDAIGASIFSPTAGSSSDFAVAVGSTKASLGVYLESWIGRDEWLVAAARERSAFLHAGDVRVGRSVLQQDLLHRSEFYVEFLRRFEVEDVVSLKITDSDDPRAPVYHMSMYRAPTGALFGSDEQGKLRVLWPHVRRALHTRLALQRADALDDMAKQALDALPMPVFVLDANVMVEHVNPQAEKCIAQGGAVVRRRHLESVGGASAVDLAPLVFAATLGEARIKVLGLGADSSTPATVHVVPIRTNPAYRMRWPNAVALLLIDLPPTLAQEAEWRSLLARKYKLTPAEARIFELVAGGADAKEVAEQLEIGYATVRTHLGRVFAKTGCKRQAELVLLAHRRFRSEC